VFPLFYHPLDALCYTILSDGGESTRAKLIAIVTTGAVVGRRRLRRLLAIVPFALETNVQKIISLFKRDYEGTRQVYDEVVPGAEWVLAGRGVATEKYDGTCCMVRDGKLYKRYDAKHGKTPPPLFEPAQDPDPATGHWPGWVPVGDGPADQWHVAALQASGAIGDGTYELMGRKCKAIPSNPIEGIVWHHPDGRMVKIKRRDLGLPWPVKEAK
jgi:hypothetical protein